MWRVEQNTMRIDEHNRADGFGNATLVEVSDSRWAANPKLSRNGDRGDRSASIIQQQSTSSNRTLAHFARFITACMAATIVNRGRISSRLSSMIPVR